MPTTTPIIPDTITVHLGRADDNARNVTVPFLDYIANVASSEIYPTWPESVLRANILAQMTFALNRIYTEFYRSRGYDFDITSSTAGDQSYVEGRDVFENIKELAGELYGTYIRRKGSVEPLFAAYCDGRRTSCDGLSQWGTVGLAEDGQNAMDILRYYYGDDIELVTDAPIGTMTETVPRAPLRIGSIGDDVRVAQIRLNRIAKNYPSIPRIAEADGIFSTDTEAAVREFQRIFGLTQDGVIGRATWYYIRRIYNGVKRISELDSEGIATDEVTKQYPGVLREGDTGLGVRNLQYFLNYLSGFYDSIPPLAVDGVFGPDTRAALIDAQNTFGLTADGVLGEVSWRAIYDAYLGIVSTIPLEYTEGVVVPFPGVPLRIGSESESVRLLQEYLNYISGTYESIPAVNVTGYFGERTRDAVLAVQALAGLPQTGIVLGPTWSAVTDLYSDLYHGATLGEGQYPGFEVGGNT